MCVVIVGYEQIVVPTWVAVVLRLPHRVIQ